MMNENPIFILAIDVVDKAIDFSSFIDYLKSERKREVTVLNANDYADVPRSSSKPTSRSSKLGSNDSTNSIVRGIKSRIDNDISKIQDLKKKSIAQAEKPRNSTHKGKIKSSLEEPKFDGWIEMLYIILNFPYVPHQLSMMRENGIGINAFLTIIPEKEVPSVQFVHLPKVSGKNVAKKISIVGSELDFLLNPNVYPPARILSLIGTAPNDIVFKDLVINTKHNETIFSIIEEEVIKIVQAMKDFQKFLETHKAHTIPHIISNSEIKYLKNYLSFYPNNYINALYFQLREGKWKSVQNPPPKTKLSQYSNIFSNLSEQTKRKVIFFESKEPPDPVFSIPIDQSSACNYYTIYPAVYPIMHWNITEDIVHAVSEVTHFISPPNMMYAYAGQKFDFLITQINKKHQLGLPMTFFEWQYWNYAIECPDISELLADALCNSLIVQSLLDEQAGILWIVTMNPISKTIGQYTSQYSLPLCMESITEYIDTVFNSQEEVKRYRTHPSVAQIVKENGNIAALLPSIEQRIEKSNSFYQVPLNYCNTEQFTAPYYFENGLCVKIHRDIINQNPTFSYEFNYREMITVKSSEDSINFRPIEGVNFIVEFGKSFTILFNDQSLFFNGNKLIVMSTNENQKVITTNGSLVFNNRHNDSFIVYPNGSISQYLDKRWVTIDKNGKSLDGVDRPHSQYVDEQTKSTHIIRPDNVEYVIKRNGHRHMVLDLDIVVEQMDKNQSDSSFSLSTSNSPNSNTSITFEFQDFPLINFANKTFEIEIDCFKFTLLENLETIVETKDYKIVVNNKSVSFESFHNKDFNGFFTQDSCQFKCQNSYLVADITGTEKMCSLATVSEQKGKKKCNYIESTWGKLLPIKETLTEPIHSKLHKLYAPRFFAVRKNLSGIEYIRPDTLNTTDLTMKSMIISHPSGDEIDMISYHSLDQIPQVYLRFKGLNKTSRANVLKDLKIPKVTRKKETSPNSKNNVNIQSTMTEKIDNTTSLYQTFVNDSKLFNSQIKSYLEKVHEDFIQESLPCEEIEEEKIQMPPQTPNPRVLNMQYHLYQQDVNNNAILNFWECKESDYFYPLEYKAIKERALSPRISLCDPPRYFKKEVNFISPNNSEAFVTQSNRSFRLTNETHSVRAKTMSSKRDSIDFGTVKSNQQVTASLKIQNTGERPLHYSYTHILHPSLKVISIPGTIFPGLKTTIKVELSPSPPQEISTEFSIITQGFELLIPVKAHIIE
ncbi:hypothetical protein TRFO_06840 [Tritrichomonas foetus]|uniref:HYDIN/VesB/CFA65-like Ig-like domain-containing protein n=1 Tax=Tritrichomonas foetus TaxID=1144522 RepID=A0A1J4K058_9EUKA|nr:hypothetical protein TRFO_06840 [Tritrichomonas foetus]|eukprot:OHT03164.1 hypothetical protein TRFO_06840 [Tritrichomonas foetus]